VEKHSNIPSAYTEEIEPNWIFAWYEHAVGFFDEVEPRIISVKQEVNSPPA
jgi:hypothetical protein